MKKLVHLLVLAAALSVGWIANAQSSLQDYQYSTGTDSTKWSNLQPNAQDVLVGSNADGRASEVMYIGFPFPFGDSVYTFYSVNSDGNIRLGETATGTGNYYFPFNSTKASLNNPKINFFGCDGYYLSGTHKVRMQHEEYGGGEIRLVLEFCLGTYSSSTRSVQYKYQVHLYPTGAIEVVFPPSAPSTPISVSHQMGLCVDNSDGWIIDTNNVATHFTNGSDVSWPAGRWPSPNTYYAFYPCKTIPGGYDYLISPTTSWQVHPGSTTNTCQHEEIYKAGVQSGRIYFFTTGCGHDATADFDSKLELYNSSGNRILSDDDGCGYPYSKIMYPSTSTDTMYLKVTGVRSIHFGSYALGYRYYSYSTLGLSTSWRTLSATISENNDKMIFQFYLDSDHNYIFKTGCGDGATANFAAKLELYDATGRLQSDTRTENCEGGGKNMQYHPQNSGNYYLVVSGESAADVGFATLAYKQECLSVPFYNYSITPNSSENWDVVTHSLTEVTDCGINRNIYRFYAHEGSTYSFKTGCGDGAIANFDTYLELYDSEGNFVTYNDDGCEEHLSKLEYTATQNGYMYLVVRGYNSWATGTYSLAYKMCVGVPDHNYTLYPSLSWNTTSQRSTTNACNLQHIYRVTLYAGNSYTFSTGCDGEATADFDTYLQLMDSNGTVLASNNNNPECSDNTLSSRLEYTATHDGFLFLIVRGNGTQSGSYRLAYRKCTGIPDFDYSIYPSSSWYTDSQQSTTDVCNGQHIYRINCWSGRKYTFSTGCYDQATADFDTYLELYDENGTWLASNDDHCNTTSRIDYISNANGYVYLVVKGFNGATGNYRLAYKYCYGYTVTVDMNLAMGGTVTGSGHYCSGEECTLTATPSQGYEFVSWTDGSNVVSTNPTYTFTVSSNRTLTANFSFTDNCTLGAINSSYYNNFDSYTTSTTAKTGIQPECWTLAHQDVPMTDAYKPMIYYSTDNAYSGNYSLILNKRCIYAMPYIENTRRCRLSLQVKQPQEKYQLQVGVMTDLTDENSFIPLWTVDNTTHNIATTDFGWYQFVFSNYNVHGHYIAFRNILAPGYTGDYSINYIDDINLDYFGNCPTISNLPFTDNFDEYTTSTTAKTGEEPYCWELVQEDVSMTDEYKPMVYYSPANAHSGNYSLILNKRGIYTMPGIAFGADFDIYHLQLNFQLKQTQAKYKLQVGVYDGTNFVVVKTFNNTTTDYEPVTVNFSTYTGSGHRIAFRNVLASGYTGDYSINYIDDLVIDTLLPDCPAITAADLPYSDNFDHYTTSTTAKTCVAPDCWTMAHPYVNMTTEYNPMVYYNASNAHSGNYSLILNKRCIYAMPEFDGNVNTLQLSFYLKQTQAKYQLQVGVMTDLTNASTFTPVATFNNSSTTAVVPVTVDFGSYTGTGRYIAFKNILASGQTGDYSINYIDDIVLSLRGPDCVAITPADLPYSDNFDHYTTSTTAKTGVAPDCWTLAHQYVTMTDEYKPMVYYSSANAHSGNYSLILNKRGIYAMPEFDGNVNTLQLSFYLKQTQTKYQLQVGVMTDLTNASTFTPVATFNNSSTTAIVQATVDFGSYTGTGRYIAFKNILASGQTGDYSCNYIDDLVLDVRPASCPAITAADLPYTDNFDNYTTSTTAKTGVEPDCWTLAHQDVTMTDEYKPMVYYNASNAHSGSYALILNKRGIYAMPEFNGDISTLQLSFYLKQTQTKYRLQVGVLENLNDAATFVPVTTINNTSTTASVLCTVDFSPYSDNGRYIAFRNILASGNTGDYSVNYIDDLVLEVRPNDCPAITTADLPYTDNFDHYTTATTAKTGVEPDCWTLTHQDVAMADEYKPMVYYNASTAHSGSYSLILNKRGFYTMPEFDGDISTLQLSFYLRQTQTKYQLQVGVLTNPADAATFVPVTTIDNTSTTASVLNTVDFSPYTGTGHYIAFHNTLAPGYSGDYSINYIDDLRLATRCAIYPDELPYSDNFDTYTTSTTAKTGVEPDCWTLAHQYVTMADEYKPMVYYNASTAHSGNYSLILNKRGIYAMPQYAGNVRDLQLQFYLTQTQTKYQLQVGVMTDLSDPNSFVSVATFNNTSTTAAVLRTVNFSTYSGTGHYIAFKNILASGQTGDYSCNYIDDLVLSMPSKTDGTDNNAEPSQHFVTLYPNPTSGLLNIAADDHVVRVELFDYTGRCVDTFEQQTTLDLSRLASGIYTLRVILPERIEVRRVVKQ